MTGRRPLIEQTLERTKKDLYLLLLQLHNNEYTREEVKLLEALINEQEKKQNGNRIRTRQDSTTV